MDEEKIEVDLGLSHGHVGVIASLLPALKYKSTHVQAKGMIESGCNWLVEQSQCVDSYGSYYAYLQGDNKESKLGWCYGDLSIAITLLRAGKAINNASYVDFALEIAKHCAAREQIPIHKNNHAICHGNIGLFLMFQTLYKLTNEDIFRETSNKWLNKTLDRYQDNGIQGIALISKKGKYNMGLLTGLPGIGLCLLSALGQDIDWTDSLLLSSSI
jgi:lantibiotic modifying enzyme